MIIDTSAILAILLAEEDMRLYIEAMVDASTRRMSAGTLLEAYVVLERRREHTGVQQLDSLLRRAPIEIVPVTVDHVLVAHQAYRRFGKGINPAGLNYGDCFAYALAKISGEPLLFKGEDFARTDVETV